MVKNIHTRINARANNVNKKIVYCLDSKLTVFQASFYIDDQPKYENLRFIFFKKGFKARYN